MPRFYTRMGDCGDTSLIGKKALKSESRVETYGSVDELNSFVGLAASFSKDEKSKALLGKIQQWLLIAGSDLAAPDEGATVPRVNREMVLEIEKEIDDRAASLPELHHFILPGGSQEASLLHVCRTICRRAERRVFILSQGEKISPDLTSFFNRLSSLFFRHGIIRQPRRRRG